MMEDLFLHKKKDHLYFCAPVEVRMDAREGMGKKWPKFHAYRLGKVVKSEM